MSIKWNFKYRTVACSIRLIKGYESTFKNGRHNICYTNNDQIYYFRMFDATISMKDIKKSYTWQAVQDVSKEVDISNSELIKKYIKKYGGHFAKILRVFGRKYVLIYFNNENDLMKALVDSAMVDELGNGLKLKSQDELISRNGNFIYRLSHRRRSNKKTTSDNDLFFDLVSGTSKGQTTILAGNELRTQDVSGFVDQFNKLNEDFSKRVTELDKDENKVLPEVLAQDLEETVVSENNKRKLVAQGFRSYDDE
jgi:hypothetical protein